MHLPMSSTKRALIAIAVMVGVVAILAALYLHRMHRPLGEAAHGPTPGLLTELPPDAPAIAYIDVAALRKLQDSPLSAVLGLTTNASSDKEYADFVRDTGFDYTRDLNQAVIAFWPTSLDPAVNAAGDNPALAVADGHFDQKKIEAYASRAGGRSEQRGARAVYIVPGRPTVSFEFLSPTRIAIASGKKSADLLDLLQSGGPNSEIQRRVQRVAGAPIFGVAQTSNLPSSLYANFSNSPQLERLVRSIQDLSIAGKPEGNAIHVALDAQCDSMKNAVEISTLLDGFRFIGSMALSDPKTRRQLGMTPEQAKFLADLVKDAHVSNQDRWVRISFDLTPEMLGQPSLPSTK
jgi:hypothetical protein